MQKVKARIATTHLDKHGDKLSLRILEDMCKATNESIIPMTVEHDPRIMPIGRYFAAEIVRLEDGEYALDAIGEYFFRGNEKLTQLNNKYVNVEFFDKGHRGICYDRNFKNKEDQENITKLTNLLQCNEPASEEIKKALDPLSILKITGCFILGAIATGFLNKIGSDAYDTLIKLLTTLTKRKKEEKEKLLDFNFTVYDSNDKKVATQIILTNPSEDDINNILQYGLKELDRILPYYFHNIHEESHKIVKLVFEYKNGEFELKYALSDDGLPLRIEWKKK